MNGRRRARALAARRERALRGGARGGAAPSWRALDGGLLVAVGVLAAIGIVMVYSATAPLAIGRPLPPQFARHLIVVGLAAACAGLALRVPLGVWRRLALPLWALGALALLATLAFGSEVNGARRWLRVPGLAFGFQPAEPAKWATLLALAALLARGGDARGALRAAALLTAPPVALLLLQPDFGNAVVMLVLAGLLLFVAGVPPRLLALPAAVAAAGAGLYVALRPYALSRWTGFLHPWQTSQAEGFQLVQSFVAFGRGGTTGVGLGDGRQKLFYLPEAHTDFILAVVAEELGLVGVLVVLGAFGAFAVAGLRIARRAGDPFAVLAAFSMTALVAVPAAVNAAVVMGLLPTKGFTLPFLSYGGSSLLTCALALGILLRIAASEAGDAPARRGWRRR
jgi:cell division protein FtsW